MMYFKAGYSRHAGGNTALSFALVLPAVLGCIGVAVDFGMLQAKRNQLQQAADAAAIAAAKELSLATSDADSIAKAAEVFARSSVQTINSTVKVNVSVNKNREAVSISLQEEWRPFFAHFLQAGITPIVVNSTATLAGEANICVLTLEPSDSKALHMDNSGFIQGYGCSIYSNSVSPQGIRLDAEAQMNADMVCSAGGILAKKGSVPPDATEDCPVIKDPLAARAEPKVAGCDYSKLSISSGSRTLMPGTYCEGLKISGDAAVTFATGDYIITGGNFEISKKATAAGENVSFYLHGDGTTLKFTEDTTVDFTGAKDGPMAGLLFFEDRSAAPNRKHRINSMNAKGLTGTIYLPRGELLIDPNSSVAASSDYTALIVNKLQVYEGSKLVLNSDYNNSNVPVPAGIRINNQVVLSK